ncbi:hypothetical protein K8T06_02420 [bacterium]|nr:hypothetical protein [bacterium]
MAPYFDDDGTELSPDYLPMPGLCLICKKKDDPNEEILCNLNRLGQSEGEKFECFAFVDIND